ncbi:hypothetical protein JG687_00001086 [Phytophthora cactorum]|uniref:Uncharacterized protein n=1 Tax=Phytophthora cactorum TaxID=29920 RepID=A0A8T1UZ16_9STRA|nr:hypothetical protein JG687_00001086 [Phytophthora cactorum]
MDGLGVVGPVNARRRGEHLNRGYATKHVGGGSEERQGVGRIDHDGDCYSEACFRGAGLDCAGQDRPGGSEGGPGDTGQDRADVAAGTSQIVLTSKRHRQ